MKRASMTLCWLAALGEVGAAQPPPLPVSITGQPGQGITLSLGDALSLGLRGRVMLRYTLTEDGAFAQELAVRRAHLYLAGHVLSPRVEYLLHFGLAQRDYDPVAPGVPLFSAYVQLTHLRDLHLRIGQQLVPFNRARVISTQNAELVDRSPVSGELNLDRDVGIKLYAQDLLGLGQRLGYEIFVGGGEGRNQGLGDYGLLYALRLQVNPMGAFDDYTEADLARTPQPRLSVGLAGAFNHRAARRQGTIGARYGQARPSYVHGALDLIFKWRGLSLMAEGLLRWSPQQVYEALTDQGVIREYARSAMGYFVQAGLVFSRHDLGVAARFSHLLALEPDTDPELLRLLASRGKEIDTGLSWFIRGHVIKIQADYAYFFGDDPAKGAHQVRVQGHIGY
jgi:hypothetical protein